MMSLLYHLLDEFLFLFSAEPFFIARVSGRSSIAQTSNSYDTYCNRYHRYISMHIYITRHVASLDS